jgi:hypothetical protein
MLGVTEKWSVYLCQWLQSTGDDGLFEECGCDLDSDADAGADSNGSNEDEGEEEKAAFVSLGFGTTGFP